MINPFFYITIFLFIQINAVAQSKVYSRKSEIGLQYGFGIKAFLELSTVKKTQAPYFKIALTGGVASSFINNNIYPAVNGELLLYNNGIGSKKPGINKNPSVNIDFITALTLTAGVKDLLQQQGQNRLLSRTTPLYYFADFGRPALRNPFAYSFSVGTNFIFNNDHSAGPAFS